MEYAERSWNRCLAWRERTDVEKVIHGQAGMRHCITARKVHGRVAEDESLCVIC